VELQLDHREVEGQLLVYQLELVDLAKRQAAWEPERVAERAQRRADSLMQLMSEAPLGMRGRISELIDQFEELRINCLARA
jgi:hypothetical protein